MRDSPHHHGFTVRTVRILTTRIEYGLKLWPIPCEIPWGSLWIQHRSHTRPTINTVEVDFLRIFLRHFGGGGACCRVSKYFTVVSTTVCYHCMPLLYYCVLSLCATVCYCSTVLSILLFCPSVLQAPPCTL